MTVFWIVTTIFLAGAMLMLLPALLQAGPADVASTDLNAAVHRDQWREADADLEAGLISPERLEQSRDELRHRVLEDAQSGAAQADARPAGRTALVLGLALPVASVLTYLALGDPDAAAPAVAPVMTQNADGSTRHRLDPAQIQQMAAALAERLKAEPNHAEGWLMLARSYTSLNRYSDAATALRRASELRPTDAHLLADLADLTGMAQGKRLAGEPARLIQRALDIDPRHVKALALAGSVAFETRDYSAARGYWERLVPLLPADSPMLKSIRGSLVQVTALEGAGAAPSAATASAAARLTGRVQVSPDLATRIQPGDTLFVFARAAQGPRMPLATVRREATLPFDFVLDDSMAMAPNLKLSGFSQVVVGARISRSGQATPQSGDLVGMSAPTVPTASGLSVTIDRIEP